MRKKEIKSCKEEVKDAIREKRTFDLDGDTNGYPTIHWLIGTWILRNYTPFNRDSMLHNGRINAIKRNFDNAIKDLEEKEKIPVYKGPANSKKIRYLTLDESYRDAKEQDYLRLIQRGTNTVNAIKRKVEFKHPNYLPEFFGRLFLPPAKEK